MDVKKIIEEKKVTITNQGMVTIPAAFRKSYGLKDGDKVLIIEDEGTLKIIPLKDSDDLKKTSYNTKEMLDQMKKSKIEELSREA
ncbi:MAG: AbrB/MazE/SpoVT family DNA-binding domain-containing protein [Candidatus Lokiarchaeota archaeon]|nr:AbrB/MazE/SpoVT family DNA-binding domain-containing protein [Candidatus Lokiarchaeota archaeon]